MKCFAGILLVIAACGGGSSSPWVVQDVPGAGQGSTYALWVFADDDVWLGGKSAWNWDGASWNEVALPGDGTYIGHFFGLAPDDLWAAASDRVFHWDGTAFTEVPAAEGLPFEAITAVWAASSSDVWLANGDNSKVYHYDGTTWTRETLQFGMADALWGSGPDDIWLTGDFDTYHYDGTAWSRYEAPDFGPAPDGAYALWGAAADDVWASSFFGLVHWDGTAWTETELRGQYNSMWGFGPNDIYAVGNRGVMAHFDGSEWNETDDHLTDRQNFTHVRGSSPDNLWATAVDFDTLSGLVLRLDN